MDAIADTEGRQLLWRCRRGMKELDLMLEAYARASLPHAAPAERAALAELLALPDPLLADWLLGAVPPPPGRLHALVGRIRALCRAQPTEGGRAGAGAAPGC